MNYKPINLKSKLSFFNDLWSPKVIAEMNNYQFKLVKIKGEFQWHCHKETDETFIVLEGEIRIKFRDGHVDLKQGEMYVVPKLKEHMPCSENESKILLIEPKNIINTGDSKASHLTAENDVWI